MTEQEWITSTDPHAMVAHLFHLLSKVDRHGKPYGYHVSDKKLQLYCIACCYLSGIQDLGQDTEQIVEWNKHPANNPLNWAYAWSGDQKQPTRAERAHLLRDIVGNPFRPLPYRTLGGYLYQRDAIFPIDDVDMGPIVRPVAWVTSTVLSLAHAAYEELDQICPYCKDADFSVGDGGLPMMGSKEPYASRAKAYWRGKCVCKGTRRVPREDHTIDHSRLSILADALTDEGCDDANILSHLRSGTIHVRGCWALDLLLGNV